MANPLELKVQACSLAAASRIIRRIEIRIKHKNQGVKSIRAVDQHSRMHRKRTHEIRSAARATHLARGFLRGLDYSEVENYTHCFPQLLQWDIFNMVKQYTKEDRRIVAQRFEEWWQMAKVYAESTRRIEERNKKRAEVKAEAQPAVENHVAL